MATPIIYYGNLFALGVLSGSSADVSNPTRRVGDSDRTLKYTLLDSVGPDVTSGQVQTTLASGMTRDYLVMVRGTALSGWTVSIESEDVGGGNNAVHSANALTGDTPFVQALSGVATARRVWRAEFVSVSGIETSPELYEVMLATRLVFPQPPLAGVTRVRVHNYQSLNVPGAAPFKLRLGEDYQEITYRWTLPQDEASGIETFLAANDGGEPFWFVSDNGDSFWAELKDRQIVFDDQAGVYTIGLKIQEIPLLV